MARGVNKSKPVFVGLASSVEQIARRLTNVSGIRCVSTRGCHGQPKIKIAEQWPRRFVEVIVHDRDHGQRDLCIDTPKPGAIARILRRELRREGLPVAV